MVQLENLMDLGIKLFDAAKTGIQRWKNRLDAGERPYLLEDAKAYQHVLIELDQAFKQIEEHIRLAVEGKITSKDGLQGMRDFESARHELWEMTCFSVERVMEAMQHVAEGKTRPLSEVMDELRARHHA